MILKKIFLGLSLLAIIILSNQVVVSTTATTSKTAQKHDEIYKSVSLTIINATIYDDRSTFGEGDIYYTVSIENSTYYSSITALSASPSSPYSYSVNFKVKQNIQLFVF